MIEKTVLNFLEKKLNIPCFTDFPEEKLDKFLLIEKTGSSEENHIFSATFAIKSYDISKLKTAELNEEVKTAMKNMVELNEISKVSLNSDYPFDDIVRKRPRYQAIFDIIHY